MIRLQRPFFLLFTLIATFSFGQVEQTTINGKSYYIYPHQQKISRDYNYLLSFVKLKQVIQRDSINSKIVSISTEPLDEFDLLKVKRMGKINKRSKKYFKSFVEMDTTYYFSDGELSLNSEPTPALQSLPDGDYVMYYRDVAYIKNKTLCFNNTLIAAIFSIKDNQLVGPSTWYDTKGKLILSGNYSNSEKDGTWIFNKYEINYTQLSIKETFNQSNFDTVVYHVDYKAGIKNGNFCVMKNNDTLEVGNFKDDIEAGTWRRYTFKEKISFNKKGMPIYSYSDEKFLYEQYTYRSDSLRCKSPIIRSEVIPYSFMEYNESLSNDTLVLFNSYSIPTSSQDEYGDYSEDAFPDFSNFYSIQNEETNYELTDEDVLSYEGAEYPEYYDEYNPENPTQLVGNKRYTTNQLIDSIGYLYNYEGVFERYYSNGQLQFRYVIKEGKLLEETPVYWDNGNIANSVTFDTDSNQFVQRFFDYNGTNYYNLRYDNKGDLLNYSVQRNSNMVTIQGQEYEVVYGNPTLSYFSLKALKTDTVSERVLIQEELYKIDTSIALQAWYYPQTRILKTVRQNLRHEDISIEEVEFSEDFKNIHISKSEGYDRLELKSVRNGFLQKQYEKYLTDSIKKYWLISNWSNYYSGESDNDLYVDGKLFSGNINAKTEQNKFKIKLSKSEIKIAIPTQKKDYSYYKKAIAKYKKNGKASEILIGYNSDIAGYNWLTRSVLSLFPMLLGDIAYSDSYTNYGFDGDKELQSFEKRKNKLAIATSLNGTFLNGKAQNKWIYKDRKGNVLADVQYEKGLEHGESNTFSFAYPKAKPKKVKKNTFSYDVRSNSPIEKYKKYPDKKTYYKSAITHYKYGKYDGVYCSFNWNGDTLSYTNYINDYAEGKYFERNQLFYSDGFAKNGFLEGKSRTFLTIPGRDSVLLFNLNFSNNLLQGESVAYHSNGNVAKKGFFLMGEPIDDYQAFDSLGNIYQYVKFQYSQPIEEKIWEENELSVRYLFDWRDSVRFDVGDITSSSSISRLLYNIGYSDESLNKPYFGRPSLINKIGINYEMTKYYPNDTIARTGTVSKGIKTGCWKYYNYSGKKLYEVEYFDSIIKVNDSISFKSKGVLFYLDNQDNVLSKSFIIEKFEKFDCSKTDHTEERMLYCFWEKDSTQHRKNGYVKNYYDNGALQNEGYVKDGLPTGIWRLYDSNGNLSQVGEYIQGKRNGRWLKGDLNKIKNMSEICLNPNKENVEELLKYQANLLDIYVINYRLGKELKKTYFGINQNSEELLDVESEYGSIY